MYCGICQDGLDDIVCYLPLDNGNAQFIEVNYCPNCGSKTDTGDDIDG